MKETYLNSLTLEEIDQRIAMTAVEAVIVIGYYLKQIRDRELYKKAGCKDVYEYAEKVYGYSYSTTSRNMSRNDRFSVGGNSLELAEEYREYGKSQLQEMVSMTEEQLGQVRPEMTVKEIKTLKRHTKQSEPINEEEQIPEQMDIQDYEDVLPEKSVATSQKLDENSSCPPGISQCIRQEWGSSEKQQEAGRKECKKCWSQWKKTQKYMDKSEDEREQVSAYGLPARTYPPDSLIKISGCGTHDCFNCHMDGCQIRQEDCRCVEAPCGNPFPCTTLNVVEKIREDIGDRCQFVNHDLAEHRAGDHELVPCCKRCDDPCGYECRRSVESRAKVEQGHLTGQGEGTDTDAEKAVEVTEELCEEYSRLTDYELLKAELDKAQRLLNDMLKCCAPEEELVRRQKILVGALAAMKCDLDLVENPPEEPEQPELPVMKNNDQRKEWLGNYKDWGLWYEDEHIGAKFYKYDFSNGARLIAEEFEFSNSYAGEYTASYLHLVGGPEPPKNEKYGICKWQRHERYSRYPNSETELVEFLKFVQKGEL